MTLRKKPTRKRRTSTPPDAEQMYDGPLPKSTRKHEGTLYLVPLADAPDAPQFPKCNPQGVPPETYYVFDKSVMRCRHMISYDAHGVGIAWDTDRDSRYFLRNGRPLLAPRYVEYSYDHSNAEKAGEWWSHSHPNYRGSLSGKLSIGTYDDYSTPKTRAEARRKAAGKPSPALKRIGGVMKPEITKRAPAKRLGGSKTTDEVMTDRSKLDKAAQSAADDLSASFGKKKLRKAKR